MERCVGYFPGTVLGSAQGEPSLSTCGGYIPRIDAKEPNK